MQRCAKDRSATNPRHSRRAPSLSEIRCPGRSGSHDGRPHSHSQLRPRGRRVYPFVGLRQNCITTPPRQAGRLRQLDRLKRANDVVRAFILEEAFVKTGAEVPMIPLVIFIAVKAPDAAYDDERTDSVVPKITQEMKAEVGPAGGPFESNVVE